MFKDSPSMFPIRIVIIKQVLLRLQKCPVDYGKP